MMWEERNGEVKLKKKKKCPKSPRVNQYWWEKDNEEKWRL